MDDVTIAILDAWAEIGPRLKSDPLELAKRLARRRMKTLRRPLRAWCLAVRASDRRIDPASAIIVPEDAAYPGREDLYREHEVTLDAQLLRRLCRPVTLSPYGHTVKEVAEMLGVTRHGVESAIDKGIFRVEWLRRVRGYGDLRVLRSERTFDPSSGNLKSRPDPVWGSNWGHLADMVPDELAQPVTRVPHYLCKRDTFAGWRWICPACGKQVRTMYYPLPPINLPEYFGIDPARDEVDKIEAPAATFACLKCHQIIYFTRIGPHAWIQLVHHLSGGLLYGSEVRRPEWLTPDRKKKFAPRQRRSVRQEEIVERLLKKWTARTIGKDLGIATNTVYGHIQKLFKKHRVHSRDELREKWKQNPNLATARLSSPKSGGPQIHTDKNRI